MVVNLFKRKMGGKKVMKQIRVHQYVAKYFIENPEGKPMVNHKDGDKTNNHVDNLEWCTHKENMQHAFKNGLNHTPKGVHTTKLNEYDVKLIRKLYKEEGLSHHKLSQMFPVVESQIRNIINRNSWKNVI